MSRAGWLSGALVVACLAVYGRTVSYPFVYWDDPSHVVRNPLINPPTLGKVAELWRKPHIGLYIPLTYTAWAGAAVVSHALRAEPGDYTLDPRVFHALNLLLHLLNCLLVFRCLRLLLRGRDAEAFAGSLLFALHPMQVEPVAWVSGARDLLAAALCLTALWRYLRFYEGGDAADPDPSPAPYFAGLAAFALALTAKPTAVVLPFMLAAINAGVYGRRGRGMFRGLWPWFLLAAPVVYLAKVLQPDAAISAVTPWSGRPWIAADALVFYLRKLVWPDGFLPDYGRLPARVLAGAAAPALALVPAALLAIGWRLRARAPWFLAVLTIGLAGLFPVLGFVPFQFQEYSTVADHYMYLPFFGVALGFGFLLRSWSGWPAARAGLFVWGAACVVLGALQVPIWAGNRALFTHTLAANPASFMAETNLGLTLADEGKEEEALPHYEAALRINPDYISARNNLASYYQTHGDLDRVIEQYEIILRHRSGVAEVHSNLGAALAKRGRVEEGIRHYQEAIRLNPQLAEAYNNLALVYLDQGRPKEAVIQLRRALELSPGHPGMRANLEIAEARERGAVAAGATGGVR